MTAVWDRYVEDVLSGRQVACRWVKAACQRHLDDLANGAARGLWFDPQAAQHVIDWFGFLRHSKGEWVNRVITLEPWQQFGVAMVFGWKRQDGLRRFRTSYDEEGRKNGKTTKGAGVALYMLVADDEGGAEIYTAATKKDQARISHSEATRMVKKSPSLRSRVRIYRDSLNVDSTASTMVPLGADSKTLDGLNVHCALVDEIHAHPTRDLYDVLETGMSSRRQPLMYGITTAGYDRQSLCYQLHDYTEKVLNRVIQDDSFFGIIYTIDRDRDEGDDWEDESVWPKANPNLGISKKWDAMRSLAHRASGMPSVLNAFLRLDLNVWTQASTKWIPRKHWDACAAAVDADGLRGRRCYAALDLSSNTDTTACVLLFPPESPKEPFYVLPRFWIPEENMHERAKRDKVPYDTWLRSGHLMTTPGNTVDYEFILAQVEADAEIYDIQQLAIDRMWGMTQIMTRLREIGGDEDWVLGFGQGFFDMAPAMRDFDRLVRGHKLAHGAHPVLNWQADNLVVAQDPAGNIKPDKEKSIERIDGMVALVMAIATSMRGGGKKKSVYETRGIRQL